MTVGAVAALSVRHVAKHFKGLGNVIRNAPYFSAGLMVAVGMFVRFHGVRHLLP
jgi:nickel/cobalt exporter